MRFIRTLRVQVQSIVDLHLEEECAYCGTSEGLNVELLQNIEDLFREFLTATGARMPGYKFQAWIRYFKEHAVYRTLCAECSEMIQEYHKKKKKLARMEGTQAHLYPQRSSFNGTRLDRTDLGRAETILSEAAATAGPQEVEPAAEHPFNDD